ncbi:uncharacterized protein RSE6_07486 [Rhynchosporium secalis]|uniref:Uncharacterized protein n=1 Tax=Rhynchosporium secalis TaxID=38038 RepID=A0A1E1MCZ1_RHYSE|nr:uncharacterized protein RSE6_07486 [Rhynchosporium secalis]
MLNDLRDAYQGFSWDTAYPGGAGPRGEKGTKDGGCDLDSFKVILEATRNAVRLATFSGTDLIQEDRSSNKFFVRNSIAPAGGRWTSSKDIQNTFASIKHNMLVPSRFPIDGTRKRRRPQHIGLQCKDTALPLGGHKGCAGTAVYLRSDAQRQCYVEWREFRFLTYSDRTTRLNQILEGPRRSEADLGDSRWISYEQVIIHEWLQTDIMGYSEHLNDLVDEIDDNNPKRRVYGMSEARDYAWKFMKGTKQSINKNVALNDTLKFLLNVENYVSYFVDKMYGAHWGWTGNGNSYPNRKRRLERRTNQITKRVLTDEGPLTNPSTLSPATWPANCHGELAIDTVDTSAFVCDYVIPPFEDDPTSIPDPEPYMQYPESTVPAPALPVVTLPSDPKNCNCNESGCTRESPSCCANGTC